MQHRSPYHDEPESKSSYDAGDRDFSSPVKGGGGGGANVHRTPSGALTRDVFRSPGGGGAGGFGGDADYDSDGGDYSAPAPVVKSPMSRFPGEGGSYQPDDGTGPDAEEPPPKEEFPEGSHPLDGIALLNENGTVNDLPTPELLSKGSDRTEVEKLAKVIGEYRVRCFYSANWVLRDAALKKASMMITHESLMESVGEDGM